MFLIHQHPEHEGIRVITEHHLCLACKRMFALNDHPYIMFTYQGGLYYRHYTCPPTNPRASWDAVRRLL